ncbi:MAG: DUF1501 domain-containing protein, partial [Planctomyces sp.]
GVLDSTLFLLAFVFGRRPGTMVSSGGSQLIFGFWLGLGGGGVRGGVVHGATDEIGFHAVQDRHYVTDIHATILRQMGLDSRRLELPDRKRLDLDHGHAIEAILGG